jgi:photosystem II stability/assembly factor-like uncharacterized protein
MKSGIRVLIAAFILFSIVRSSFSEDSWIRIPSPTTKWLFKCTFVDSLNGWAVGDSGVIIHTSDAGANWQVQNSHIDYFISDLFFLNKRLGWAIANDFFFFGTTILKTTNSGANWIVSRYPDTTKVLYTVYYLDSLNGFMGGYQGVVLRTSDAGSSWTEMHVDSGTVAYFPIEKFAFINPQYGLACGGIIDISGVIWTTTDYGSNWKSSSVSPEPLYDILWRDSLKTFSCGGDYEFGGSFLKSNTGGGGWAYNYMNIFGVARRLAFRTNYEIWIPMGFSQRWSVSSDTGNTWAEVMVPDTSGIYDAVFIDSIRGWAFGTNGSIYKFNSAIIGIPPQNNLPFIVRLGQNYPNPFNPSTAVKYSVSRFSRVKITLFNMLGRQVKILLDDVKYPGEYTLQFNADGLSSGVYFYKLDAGNYSVSKKMVLMK